VLMVFKLTDGFDASISIKILFTYLYNVEALQN
jgi:hypothetical protein